MFDILTSDLKKYLPFCKLRKRNRAANESTEKIKGDLIAPRANI